jgi:hypothetical protein
MNSQVSSEWIVNATRRYIAERAKTHPDIASFVETVDALPLYASFGGGVALRSDGELIGFMWDDPQSIKPEADPHLRFLALLYGSESYPELAPLAPRRTNLDRDCPLCQGTGLVAGLENTNIDPQVVRCYCGGSGWLPSNVPDPPGC